MSDLDGVQFEKYRKVVDPTYTTLHDSLTDAYYNYWAKGVKKAWQKYNSLVTTKDSKIQFDKLHALIWAEHLVALKAEDDTALIKEDRFKETMVDKKLDKDNNPVDSSYDRAVEQKTVLNIEGYTIAV